MNIRRRSCCGQFGVPTGRGIAAFSPTEAVAAAEKLGGPVLCRQAQIHAGGRGKGGGIKVVRTLEEVRREAKRMLGMALVTPQTGPQGRTVTASISRKAARSPASSTSPAWSTARTSRIAFIASPRRHGHREGRP